MRTKAIFPVLCLLLAWLLPTALAAPPASGSEPGAAPATAVAQPAPAKTVVPDRTTLPQDHPYQRVLRRFMATLTEKDFDHGVTEPLSDKGAALDAEGQYRTFIMTLMHQPLVGWKRGTPAVNAPPKIFLLATIEGQEGVLVPPVYPETLVAFTRWKIPGNPYAGNRALRMRAFVTAAIRLMMLDDYFETHPEAGRSDWNAYSLISWGGAYIGLKELLPPEVQKAFEEGLLRLGRRILQWGPKGEEPNLDLIAPLGLWYVSKATGDAAFARQAEAYARLLFTDPRYFHPAGYWLDRGGVDVGFCGMANFWAIWTALATDWPFAKEAVARTYRLRSHLMLPEPDGRFTGPSHFNSRLGSPACDDQWHWDGARDHAGAMVTDEAVCLLKMPAEDQLTGAMANRVAWFNFQIKQNPVIPSRSSAGRTVYLANEDIRGRPWKWRLWSNYSFPAGLNPGYEFYRAGAWAHLRQLAKEGSPLLKPPLAREGTFIKNFENTFVVAKQPAFAAILHFGPVGDQRADDGLVQYRGPLGLGGGQLSAFWTPTAGSVLLGRRSGMSYDKTFDNLDEWRTWPIHAVSGTTAAGKFFTAARIVKPEVAADVQPARAHVQVRGTIPATIVGQDGGLEGRIDYVRTFTVDPQGVTVETVVSGDGKDLLAELYETLPVFVHEAARKPQEGSPAVAIEFQVGGAWVPATDAYAADVQTVRITRCGGAVQIAFERPRRMKLSPQPWKDTFLSRAVCRTILIDLLDSGDRPAAIQAARSIRYQITAMAKGG